MCPFEILHFIPLALIVCVALFARNRFSKIGLSLISSGLSIIGLTAGSHVHTAHMEPITLLDPCIAYFATIAISFAICAVEFFKIRQFNK